jgi:leader peptidase (prepilin peptidase) / N-methyltransferase
MTRSMRDAVEILDLRPNPAILLGAGGALALVSAAFLPWPCAIASTVLGALMIAGADVDARTFLLPDTVTLGAAVAGIIAAPLLDPIDPWLASVSATARALGCAAVLALLRAGSAQIRQREGMGFGDVKLAAAVGAWLPLGVIPLCFALATSAALVSIMIAHWRGHMIERASRVPFGTFLCPSLWVMFYASALSN